MHKQATQAAAVQAVLPSPPGVHVGLALAGGDEARLQLPHRAPQLAQLGVLVAQAYLQALAGLHSEGRQR